MLILQSSEWHPSNFYASCYNMTLFKIHINDCDETGVFNVMIFFREILHARYILQEARRNLRIFAVNVLHRSRAAHNYI